MIFKQFAKKVLDESDGDAKAKALAQAYIDDFITEEFDDTSYEQESEWRADLAAFEAEQTCS